MSHPLVYSCLHRFSSFLQQHSTTKGNEHMRSKNEMAVQSAFAGSSTSGTRSVTVLSVDTYPKYYVTYLQQC